VVSPRQIRPARFGLSRFACRHRENLGGKNGVMTLSISARMIAPPEKAFFTTYGPSYDGVNFPRESERAMFLFFRTRSPGWKVRGRAFLL
jgi:hypothetical protein